MLDLQAQTQWDSHMIDVASLGYHVGTLLSQLFTNRPMMSPKSSAVNHSALGSLPMHRLPG